MKVTLYSKADDAWLFQEVRSKLFSPIFPLFRRLKITPVHITGLSFIFGLASFIVIWFSFMLAGLFFILHLFFDMLDGTYARYTKKQTNKGALLDIVNDMFVFGLLVIALIGLKIINPLLGAGYLFLYVLLLMFSIVRNVLEIQGNFSARTRGVFLIFLLLYFLFNFDLLNLFLILACATMLINLIVDLIAVSGELN